MVPPYYLPTSSYFTRTFQQLITVYRNGNNTREAGQDRLARWVASLSANHVDHLCDAYCDLAFVHSPWPDSRRQGFPMREPNYRLLGAGQAGAKMPRTSAAARSSG